MSRLTTAIRVLLRRDGQPRVWGTLRAELPLSAGRATFVGSCSIGAMSYCDGEVRAHNADIGRYCSIASGAVIGAGNHRTDRLSTHPAAGGDNQKDGRVQVGNDVWIGTNAIVMLGVTVGDGAVIGAGAIVTHDVPPFAVAAGVPARVLRYRFDPATIDRIRQSAWWRYDMRAVAGHADLTDALCTAESGQAPVLDPTTRIICGRLPPNLT